MSYIKRLSTNAVEVLTHIGKTTQAALLKHLVGTGKSLIIGKYAMIQLPMTCVY